MRILPCRHCNGPALARRAGGGSPAVYQTLGRISNPVISYLCRGCGRTTRLTSDEFTRLPQMTDDEIRADSCDITHPDDLPTAVSAAVPAAIPAEPSVIGLIGRESKRSGIYAASCCGFEIALSRGDIFPPCNQLHAPTAATEWKLVHATNTRVGQTFSSS